MSSCNRAKCCTRLQWLAGQGLPVFRAGAGRGRHSTGSPHRPGPASGRRLSTHETYGDRLRRYGFKNQPRRKVEDGLLHVEAQGPLSRSAEIKARHNCRQCHRIEDPRATPEPQLHGLGGQLGNLHVLRYVSELDRGRHPPDRATRKERQAPE